MAKRSSTAQVRRVVSGFVLAGGKSRRMGRDKAELIWNGHPLLDHTVQLLSTVTDRIRVVGRSDLPDRIPDKGPLGGILTALESSETEMNLVLGVDMPLLTREFLRFFRDQFLASARDIMVCRIDDKYPLCIGVRKALIPAIAERIAADKLSIHDFVDGSDVEILPEEAIAQAGFQRSMFTNLNRPEDWDRVLADTHEGEQHRS